MLTDDGIMASIAQEASYDSMVSDLEISGILFAHENAGAPPPWSIILSVGDQPCFCSGLQLITKRDPALTLDEQIMQEYEVLIRRVQEYWDLQQRS